MLDIGSAATVPDPSGIAGAKIDNSVCMWTSHMTGLPGAVIYDIMYL
jgi:hypothetical protein